jgi:hypothetical protein
MQQTLFEPPVATSYRAWRRLPGADEWQCVFTGSEEQCRRVLRLIRGSGDEYIAAASVNPNEPGYFR